MPHKIGTRSDMPDDDDSKEGVGDRRNPRSEDLVLELADNEIEELRRHARARGVSVEEYARDAIHEYLAAAPGAWTADGP